MFLSGANLGDGIERQNRTGLGAAVSGDYEDGGEPQGLEPVWVPVCHGRARHHGT